MLPDQLSLKFSSSQSSLIGAQSVSAQETARTLTVDSSAQKVKADKKVSKVSMAQVSLSEETKLRADIEQCGAACTMGGSGMISAGTGTTRDYECVDGNCHCFGAQDCVAMAPVCEEGTLGCNDQGCICEEG